MPRSNLEWLFLASTLGAAKCQVPGVPACPERGRAGKWSLKDFATRFPREGYRGGGGRVGGAGNSVPTGSGGLHHGPVFVCIPSQGTAYRPFLYTYSLRWFLKVAQGTGAYADYAINPEVPEPPRICWPRGRHALQSLSRVWIPS
jgi:hypothetical protein